MCNECNEKRVQLSVIMLKDRVFYFLSININLLSLQLNIMIRRIKFTDKHFQLQSLAGSLITHKSAHK